MQLQNRVTPRGEIIISKSRGTLMGNRGCLHNGDKQIVRPSKTVRWITCLLQFMDYKRPELMVPGNYTELFFLDEATALAAGHRPCSTCQNQGYKAFKAAWFLGQGLTEAGVGQMDNQLHAERMSAEGGKITYSAPIAALPDGTFIEWDGRICLLCRGKLLGWSPDGYRDARSAPSRVQVQVLTPKSIVAVLQQNYVPGLHSSAQELLGQ